MSENSDSQDHNTFGPAAPLMQRDAGRRPAPLSDAREGGSYGALAAERHPSPSGGAQLARFLRYKWSALCIALAIGLPGVLAVWFLYSPRYEARAALYIEPTKPTIAFKDVGDEVFQNYRQYRNDQAANLRSPAVLNRVLEDEQVRQTSWYQEASRFGWGGAPSKLELLRDELNVETPRDSSFVYVSLRWRDAREAALIVNTVIRECVEYVANEYDSDDETILALQEKNAEKLELDTRVLKSEIADLLERSGLFTENPDALVQQKVLRLDARQSQSEELKRELQLIKRRLGRSEGGPGLASALDGASTAMNETPDSRPARAADPQWRALNDAVLDAEFALDVARKRFGDSHPEMIKLRSGSENSRARLKEYEERMDALPPLRVASGASGAQEGIAPRTMDEYSADLEYQLAELKSEIEAARADLKQTAAQVRELGEKQQELRNAQERLTLYRQRAYARKAERQAPPWIKERPAVVPAQAVNAKQRYMLLLFVLLGAGGAGLVWMYVRGGANPVICTLAEVMPPSETPFLGYLPRVNDPQALSPTEELVQSEHMRMIRTALFERIERERENVVLITSAGAGAGKTTVAMQLGKSLAQCGRRVLLIDADLRNPRLSERCGLPTTPGLIGVLRDRVPDDKAITHNGIGGLFVLQAGDARQLQDAELLANGVFQARLQRWRKEYDLVLLDAPPVIPVADARILARQVDGAVMVLRAEHCRRDEVFEALAALNCAGSRLLGTIFVGGGGRHGYSSYYHNYYYQPSGPEQNLLDVRQS